MNENDYSAANNQTTFSEQEVLFEETRLPEAPNPEVPGAKASMTTQKKVLIGVGVVAGAMIGLFVLFLLISGNGMMTEEQTTPTATPQVKQEAPSVQKVLDLQDELNSADPVNDYLPLPPVDFNLRLEPNRE